MKKHSTIRLANGKCLWKQPGHAKSALTNHLTTKYYYSNKIYGPQYKKGYITRLEQMGFKNAKELSHYLVDQKILTIEKL